MKHKEKKSFLKRELDEKASLVNRPVRDLIEISTGAQPDIFDRVNCESLYNSRCNLKLKIKQLGEELEKTDAVLGLFGQSIEKHRREYGSLLHDYYYGESNSNHNRLDYDKIVVLHSKLETAATVDPRLLHPGFDPKPYQKVRIHETVSPFDHSKTEDIYMEGTFRYCFVDPENPGKYQELFYKYGSDIHLEAFKKGYIIVDEDGFEILNRYTFETYVLGESWFMD